MYWLAGLPTSASSWVSGCSRWRTGVASLIGLPTTSALSMLHGTASGSVCGTGKAEGLPACPFAVCPSRCRRHRCGHDGMLASLPSLPPSLLPAAGSVGYKPTTMSFQMIRVFVNEEAVEAALAVELPVANLLAFEPMVSRSQQSQRR